jgi:hypothetical protein
MTQPQKQPRFYWERNRDKTRNTIEVFDRDVSSEIPIAVAVNVDVANEIVTALGSNYDEDLHTRIFGDA